MADYELEEMWPGPDVSARYRVEGIAADLVKPLPTPPGVVDEFDDAPYPRSRTVTGLRSTHPPPDLIDIDVTDEGELVGEDVSVYLLLLTPVDPLL